MTFEDYKNLDGKPENCTEEDLKALREKYGVELKAKRSGPKVDWKKLPKAHLNQKSR